ncbi:MAG TPA: fibronectin type III domain-containing protein [Blastocatellia bacterium]|nr:fibronectin type III domain-containing protein [Blastocatellia bacterium]
MIRGPQARKSNRLNLMLATMVAFWTLWIGFGTSAQSQTLFSDNFEDGNATGWTKSGGTWAVVTDGSLVYRQSGTSADSRARAGSTAWTNYSVQARVKPLAFNGADRYVALLARAQNSNHFYYLGLQNGNRLVLAKRDGGTSTTLASGTISVAAGTFYTLRIDVDGSSLRGYVNGGLQLTATDGDFAAGAIGGATFFSSAAFDDFVVTPLPGGTPQPPAAPTGLSAAAGNAQVSLSWSPSASATGYNVKRATVSGGPYAVIANGVAATSFTNTGLTNGTTYFYVVSAVNGAGESGNSAQVGATPQGGQTAPAAPTGLSASPGDGLVSLGWNASASATSYNVKRATVSGGPYAVIASGVTATSFTNTGLSNGTTYFYVVSAVNGAGESGNSAQVSATPTQAPAGDRFALVGFATVNSLGQNGTTGGQGGPTVTVSTAADFLDYISRTGPYIIRVNGMLSLPGPMHDVTSDKTILGVGANSGITGAGLNIGTGVDDDETQQPPNAVHNIIIRNMRITNAPDDCLNIQDFAHHIWIDHNDLSNANDGALDIKRGSDFITVSWNHFHDQDKNSLVGHSDSNGAQDLGRLRITYHHNWFNGSIQRNPRVRFAEPVHIYNNYYINNTGYGIASQMNAGVMVEANYFDTVEKPTRNDVAGDPGRIVQRLNLFVNSDPPVAAGTVVEPRTYYSYTLDAASSVPSLVQQLAGVGKLGI